MSDRSQQPSLSFGPSAESALLTLAILFFVAIILSAITFIPRGSSADLASSGRNGGVRAGDAGTVDDGSGVAADGSGDSYDTTSGGSSGSRASGGRAGSAAGAAAGSAATTRRTSGGTTTGGGSTAGGGSSSGGSGGTGGGGTATGGVVASTGGTIDCSAGASGGATDTGVTGTQILLGAVTVDDGPGASFLQPEDIAMQAVVRTVNNAGGICGRQVKLSLHDSKWDAQTGAQYIQNMVEGDKVFALAVNPDSEGLNASSTSGYLDSHNVLVVGTDGLLISQYQDPNIWPIAASTVSAMHAIAISQYNNMKASGVTPKASDFSLVYERTYRFGREGANAYDHEVKSLVSDHADIPGYSDPFSNPQCQGQFCGVEANDSFAQRATTLNNACGNSCKAGAVLLEPSTAQQWFKNGGNFGGVQNPGGGAGAAPQPLFDANFANACGVKCNNLRLWTGFKPPVAQFAGDSAVQRYVNDLKGYSSNVDVNNQFAEGGYLGMRLTVDVLAKASQASGGLTRQNVKSILDSTSNYDIGLTVAPLTWSAGHHFALTKVHAFDESFTTNLQGWQWINGSATTDPDPSHV